MRARWLVIAAVVVAGCTMGSISESPRAVATSPGAISASPSTQPMPSATPRSFELGDALTLIAAPSASVCDRILRTDRPAARRIRVAHANDGLAADDARLTAAASDPTADMTQLGIPLLSDDVAVLQTAGIAIDGRTAITLWASTGRQDLFGGAWIDPPEDQFSLVVSVVDGDRAAHELARCLERPGVRTRYVFAERSQADLHAIQAAIEADRETLPLEGIRLIGTAQLPNENVVEVGLQGLTDEIVAELIERYGEGIRVVEDRPSVLD